MADSKRSIQNFLRNCTPEEKLGYTNDKGPGSSHRKAKMREAFEASRLKNGTGRQQSETTMSHSETKIGTYRSFWVIAEKEGGLMDRDEGIRIATNICSACERTGPPAVMWDPAGKVLKYMHCEIGVSDAETKMRKSILDAELDMDSDEVIQMMQRGVRDGMIKDLPADALKLTAVADGSESKGNVLADTEPESNHPAPSTSLPSNLKGGGGIAASFATLLTSGGVAPTVPASSQPSDVGPVGMIQAMLQALQQDEKRKQDQKESEMVAAKLAAEQLEAQETKRRQEEEAKKKSLEEKKKQKTHVERVWGECNALGKKLSMMHTNGKDIMEQASDEKNLWWWARDQTTDLVRDLNTIKPTVDKWKAEFQSSSMGLFQSKQGESVLQWLKDYKQDVDSATATLEKSLGTLVTMHNGRLRSLASNDKPKPAKKQTKNEAVA